MLIAGIQRARHLDGLPRFLIKGGAYLELRLGLSARATLEMGIVDAENNVIPEDEPDSDSDSDTSTETGGD